MTAVDPTRSMRIDRMSIVARLKWTPVPPAFRHLIVDSEGLALSNPQ